MPTLNIYISMLLCLCNSKLTRGKITFCYLSLYKTAKTLSVGTSVEVLGKVLVFDLVQKIKKKLINIARLQDVSHC